MENGGYDQFIEDQNKEDDEVPYQSQFTKVASILDNITDNRAERLEILLSNLKTEDLCHIVDAKIPAFLRIDKDI